MTRLHHRMTSWRALTIISISTFLSMSVWFSASSVVSQLAIRWSLTPTEASFLTIGVQLGFVIGALGIAVSGLADLVPGRTLITFGAVIAALSNLALLWAPNYGSAVALRCLTGIALAAVYPPALKEVSTWFAAKKGLALGIMIGALTLGTAFPNLINAAGGLRWEGVIVGTTLLALLAGLLIRLLNESGPYPYGKTVFKPGAAFRALRLKKVLLTNIGYIGHMWELYAMWAWIATLFASLPGIATHGSPHRTASLLAFVCIAVGSLGCLLGGFISDRFGRARAAFLALVCSGLCCVFLALGRTLPLYIVVSVCAFWGLTVIADSAQFSALITDHAPREAVGSSLSFQLAIGYLVTIGSIWLVPWVVTNYSWSVALALLALGPLVGATAMAILARSSSGGSSDASAAPIESKNK